MKRMGKEELAYLQEHWQLGTVSGHDREHMVNFKGYDYVALCGVHCHSLHAWTKDRRWMSGQLKRLCPNCKKLARRKRDADSGTGNRPA